MSDLHTRILHALAARDTSIVSYHEVNAALRAVVERHYPTTVDTKLPACSGCSSRAPYGGWIAWVAHPCGELQLIADQLGLTEGERP